MNRPEPYPSGTTRMETRPLALALGACVLFIVVGTLTGGDQAALEWYAELERPEFRPPTLLVLLMSAVYYVIMGTVLYRAQVHVGPAEGRRLATLLTLVVMAVNALWNAIFMSLQVLVAGVVGIAAFVLLLLWLWLLLLRRDRPSFWVLSPYVLWSLYDLAWSWELWRLNS